MKNFNYKKQRHLTINEALKKAEILLNQNRLDEAEKICKSIIASPADDILKAHANHLAGLISFKEKQYHEALDKIKKAISISNNIYFHINISKVYIELKQLENACNALITALNIDPLSDLVHACLGEAYFLSGNLSCACTCFKKSITINPKLAEAHKGLITVLSKLDKTDDCLSAIDTACSHDFVGEIQSIILTYRAIYAWLSRDLTLLENTIALISMDKNILSYKERQFIVAYINYLICLFNFYKSCPPIYYDHAKYPDAKTIYVIGESHSLSLAHTLFNTTGGIYRVVPKINIGCKAWHLANPEMNHYKACLKTIADTLPDNANVMVTFGEIDCRPDGGIYLEVCKGFETINKIIENIVNGYMNFVLDSFSKKTKNISFITVPAPVLSHLRKTGLEFEDHVIVKIVCLFNEYLRKYTMKYKLGLLDAYYITADENGVSNNRFHIDGVHLAPHYLLAAALTPVNTNI